jgi:hypothetical protein
MSKYKLIQLTNNNIGAINANNYLPLGIVTRRLNAATNDCSTFQVTSSTSDTVTVNEPGYYKVTYSASLTAAATGTFPISLIANQDNVYTVSETVAAADDVINLTLVYTIRVCPNCCSAPYNCPISLQIQLGDIATSATIPSTANLVIEKIA